MAALTRGEGLSSVRNAARLMAAFTPSDRDLGVSELAVRLGLAKSTVHRLLTTLSLEHFVERDATTGRYRLGLKLYELGTIVADHLDIHEVVEAPIEELRDRTGETVHVAILDGTSVVYIARRESPHPLTMLRRVGHRNDAHCTSTGKVLLAALTRDERDALLDLYPFPVHTERTIRDRVALEAELDRIRERGFAENVGESEIGAHSVAAPIRDASGRVVAAISAAGPALRFTPESTRRITVETLRVAEAISMRLGWRVGRVQFAIPSPMSNAVPGPTRVREVSA